MSSRFRLRYQAVDFALSDRDFVAGRVPGCDLVLDDNLVSRRHASFRVAGDAVELTDLGSRNGVLVNGARIQGSVLLRRGDRVTLGSQQLVVYDSSDGAHEMGTSELARCHECGAFIEIGKKCPACTGTATMPRIGSKSGDTQAGSSLLADKALSLGRFDEAERLLSGNLAQTLSRASSTPEPSADALKLCASYALRLAEGLHKPSWLDYPFDLYGAARQLMPMDLIEELYRVAARVRYVNPHALRRYLTTLRGREDGWAANERFLLLRLEGLERRIVSG